MSFGRRLKEARHAKKLTQIEVAEILGIDDTTISKYENNKSEPDNETIRKLSSLYNCSIDFLLGKSIEKNQKNEAVVNDAQTTIKLIEDEAARLGLSPTDPAFKKMLSDAFDLLRLARGKNNE